jgi:succinoglycan biosynthesis transport protein ExoP
MQLRHDAWVIRRGLWIILLGTVISAGATYAISKYIVTPVYQISALIQVNGPVSASNNTIYSNEELALNYSLLVTTNDVLQVVAQHIPGESISQLKKAVSASPLAGSSIIEIRAQANDPQLAAKIANEVAKDFIQLQVAKATAGLQARANTLSQNLATAKASVDMAQAQLTALQKAHAPADKIAHENDILSSSQQNYNQLLGSYQQIQLQEQQADGVLKQIQQATPPDTPLSPQPMLNTIIAASLGLLLMVVLVLVLDWADITIKTPEDVAQLARLEPLGSIPLSKRPLLLIDQPGASAAAEDALEQALAIISASFNALKRSQRVLLVTGLRRGAGASTTVANLAIWLAQSGKRVLLVDANLRWPSLHKIFHSSNERGLVYSLPDVYQFHAGMLHSWLGQWATHVPNLWLLPSGPVPAHPPAILRSPELRALVRWLLGGDQMVPGRMTGGIVDIIIFDTASLQEGADTVTLAPITDSTVLVVEAGKEQYETLNKAQATLQRLGSPVLGVIVNRQTAKHRSYFYADYLHKNTIATESSSQRNAIEPSMWMERTLSPGTPVSAVQAIGNDQAGSTLQLMMPLDGGGSGHGEPIAAIRPFTLRSNQQHQEGDRT